MIRKTKTAGLTLAMALGVMPGLLRADVTNPVAVSSTASVDYVQSKSVPGAPKPETYLFFQGKFYGGTTRDPDLEHAQFGEIAKTLGENMVHQNYFPSKDPKEADLLIAVHWGTTTIYENPNAQDDLERLNTLLAKYNAAIAAGKHPDPSALNQAQAVADAEQAQIRRSIGINAELLGYRQEIAKDQQQATAASSEVGNLFADLAEERYFVILMAYDFHSMKKGSTPKLLWSTRFSIRAAGNSFTGALPVMSKVAANYFGRAIDGLKLEKPGAPEGKVDVGVPTVVGDGK
jgi:hypothetical protein